MRRRYDPPRGGSHREPHPRAGHNTSSTLSAADTVRIFDRFDRADPARSRDTGGSGLGLAIVKQLVEAQGGRVWASSDAGVVTVGFSLPPAD